jgi:NADP-dependent 3-hydroxy acid dehydrogenase YdfG
MNLQLVGKRALVTGASAGIGVAIGEALGREGARVLVHGRDVARVRAVVGRWRRGCTDNRRLGD